jgi:hypothetical protein
MVRVPAQSWELAVAKDATQISDLPDRTGPRELIAELLQRHPSGGSSITVGQSCPVSGPDQEVIRPSRGW